MASNRQVAFVRHVLHRVTGIEHYAKPHGISIDGDTIRIELKRRGVKNKATRIEIISEADGSVRVSFLKETANGIEAVSEHFGVPFDGISAAIRDHTGILTPEIRNIGGSRGFRMSSW